MLTWKPVDPNGAEEVRYHVAVFDRTNQLVHEANDLRDTSHRVDSPLSPGRYRWTVRPQYLRDGKWEAGAWNRRKYFWFAVVVFGWGEKLYEFQVSPGAGSSQPQLAAHRDRPSDRMSRRSVRHSSGEEMPDSPEAPVQSKASESSAAPPIITQINAKVSAVQFFTDDEIDGSRVGDFARRCESANFESTFDQASTRYVWFCVFFSPIGKFTTDSAEISMALRRVDNNSIVLWFPVTTVPAKSENPFLMLLQGYGAAEKGKITAGKYAVEVYFESERIGIGRFSVE
jgi:hypothetical protein